MRKAIDWEKGLSNALAKSLENTGYRGASGAKAKFLNNDGDFSGTTPAAGVTTENQSEFHHEVASGYSETQNLQPFPATVTTGTTVTTEIEVATDERAAIIEFEAGIPRAWAEGFARLDCQKPLAGYSEMQWRQIIDDGGCFLDSWAAQAADMTWTVTDLFGLNLCAPRNRYDAMGLVFLIGGGRVTAINERSATIRRGHFSLTYTRSSRAGVCVWEMQQ